MPSIGPKCHELRVRDESGSWRIVCRVDPDAIVIADVFLKKSRVMPAHVLEACRRRLRCYDDAREVGELHAKRTS
jgi:phage-related protein